MKRNYNRNKEKYQIVYKIELREFKDYFITEEEYFDYYQNSCDPTFVNYCWKKNELVATDIISYHDTVFNLLRQGKKMSALLRKDFQEFIAEWLLAKGWNVYQSPNTKNQGISIISERKFADTGIIKCIWIVKKYSHDRPVGIGVVRELGYLISKVGASKGIIVTTSRLTKGALKVIEENPFQMFYIDNKMFEKEFQDIDDDKTEDLPF